MITEIAPAKINLFLHVTGRREDGYHTLSSLVVFDHNVFDHITVAPANEFGFTLKTDSDQARDLIDLKDNLVVRAAENLAEFAQRELRCHITLEKNLPVGGGVGGGSSDAAATIKALERYWQFLNPKDKKDKKPHPVFAKDAAFDKLLLGLGADVPVCYFARPCLMRGIGEVIEPLPFELPDFNLTLHPQDYALSTKDSFETFKTAGHSFDRDIKAPDIPHWKSAKDMADWLAENTVNSLEKVSETNMPQNVENSLLTRISGSGPTCFSIL